MKLYIAGPMTGYPDFNYPAFNTAAEQLQAAGFETLNPVDSEQHNPNAETKSWRWYMRHALRMIADADGIALLPGWEESRGAQLEHHIAEQLALPAQPLVDWLRPRWRLDGRTGVNGSLYLFRRETPGDPFRRLSIVVPVEKFWARA